jgi:NADH-quinone oxidoreductase subunit C
MMADIQEILNMVRNRFESEIISADPSSDIPSIVVRANSIYSIIEFLKNDSAASFEFLTDICGVHYPENELPLGIVYHLHNLGENKRIRIKTFLPLSKPEVATITPLFSAANWMERETYDFYGIIFTGHPNLKRILNVEYLDFFPMRKEYPLEDPTREDKDNRYFGR